MGEVHYICYYSLDERFFIVGENPSFLGRRDRIACEGGEYEVQKMCDRGVRSLNGGNLLEETSGNILKDLSMVLSDKLNYKVTFLKGNYKNKPIVLSSFEKARRHRE